MLHIIMYIFLGIMALGTILLVGYGIIVTLDIHIGDKIMRKIRWNYKAHLGWSGDYWKDLYVKENNTLKISFKEWLVFYEKDPNNWKCFEDKDNKIRIPYYKFSNVYTKEYFVKFTSRKDFKLFNKFWNNNRNIDVATKTIIEFSEKYNQKVNSVPTPPTSGSNVISPSSYEDICKYIEKNGWCIR